MLDPSATKSVVYGNVSMSLVFLFCGILDREIVCNATLSMFLEIGLDLKLQAKCRSTSK